MRARWANYSQDFHPFLLEYIRVIVCKNEAVEKVMVADVPHYLIFSHCLWRKYDLIHSFDQGCLFRDFGMKCERRSFKFKPRTFGNILKMNFDTVRKPSNKVAVFLTHFYEKLRISQNMQILCWITQKNHFHVLGSKIWKIENMPYWWAKKIG